MILRDEKTMFGSAPSSRFATARNSPLRAAVKRRISKDVESRANAPSASPIPRFSNFGDMQSQVRLALSSSRSLDSLD